MRVVALHGVLVVGVVGSGRGAWLCPDENCLRDALRKGALARALKVSVTDVAGADSVSAFLNHVRA